jgi:hypothetical protein
MNNKTLIIGGLIGIIGVYIISSAVVESRTSEMVSKLNAAEAVVLNDIKDIARELGRGASTEEVDLIVGGCTFDEQSNYDTLLSQLDKGLERAKLVELSDLFSACGSVAATKRSSMVALLSAKQSELETVTNLKSILAGDDAESDTTWADLVRVETEISQTYNQLVTAQGRIISALLRNVAPTELAIESIRATAQMNREKLSQLTGEASKIRQSLLND